MEYSHGKVFERQGINFLILKDDEKIDFSYLENPDIIIIDCSEDQLTRRLIHAIRSAEKSDLFLKVVLLYDRADITTDLTRASADKVIDELDNLGGIIEKVRQILERLQKTKDIDESVEIT
ncbi:hypothetical protein [Fodinibius saliphilus]|uniref:hypothetical protein n=1 Tax=Fodinibius saliphilus TaxID=1920650 RepID=UPI0011091CD7|nr:hypothetical protein [Fodinibius saliphilus]